MPVKLIPHLSFPVTRFSTMKPNDPPCRVIPIFNRIFPHKLIYQSFSKKLVFPILPLTEHHHYHHQHSRFGQGVRRYSTRPGFGSGLEIRASKSLIEDEAELSDWVTELRSNTFKTRLQSDSDKDDEKGDSGRFRRGNRGRGEDERGGKRRRESDSGGFRVSDRGRGARDSLNEDSRGKGRFGGGENEKFGSRRRESDSGGFRVSDRGRGAWDSFNEDSRGKGKFDGGENEKFGSRRRENGFNYSSDSSRQKGRDSLNRFSGNSRGKEKFSGGNEKSGLRRENGFNYSNDSSRQKGRESFDRFSGNSRLKEKFSGGNEKSGLRRENGFNYSNDSSRQKGRESFDRFSGNSRLKEKFSGGNEKFGLRRKENGLKYSNDSSRQKSRDSYDGSLGGKGRFSGEFEGKNEGFMSQERERKRGLEMGYRRNEGGGGTEGVTRRGGKSLGRTGLVMSDEDNVDGDDDDDVVKGRLRELISDEESEDEVGEDLQGLVMSDEDNVDDDDVVKGRFRELISDEDIEESADEIGEEEEDEGDDVFRKTSLSQLEIRDSVPVSPKTSPGRSDSYLSETRFDQCSISPLSLKGIKDAGYERMTVVQEATLPVILKGKDVLAKAKTGTGKTVAFLLPSIEVVVKSPLIDRDQKRPPILVLVICPTRELASQAAAEANTLLKYHPSIGVQVVIGGTRLALEQKRMQANPCQVLVATPGRLKDHIENTAGFATRLMGVKVLVLDEADHLLDMGFRKDIERIIAAVPKQRQTLLFSATIPQEVRQICHIALKRDHEYINTVLEGSEETHSQVKQMHLVAPLDKQFSLLYALLKEHIADDVDYKVLVFCTTAMVTRLVADLLGELNLNIREIHSRKPQAYRTRVSNEFRKSNGLILVTSDVSARGVDYPDVTLVVQVGLPADKQQYIHRLGRTGRKGKEGQGILLLAPWEEFFLSTIKDLPITKAPVPLVDPEMRKKVERALSHVEMKNKEAAYQAWLGYYNSNKNVGRDKYKLVELANEFSRSMGLDNPPAIPKLVLGKMGLRSVPGLRVR